MINLITTILGGFFPAKYIGAVISAIVIASFGAVYLYGRADGSAACELRHQTAIRAAEVKRKQLEATARQNADSEDAIDEKTERANDDVEKANDSAPACLDGEWLWKSLSKLR